MFSSLWQRLQLHYTGCLSSKVATAPRSKVQTQLLDTGLLEPCAIECMLISACLQSQFAARCPKAACKHIGISSAPGLPHTEPRVVATSPAGLPDQAQNTILAVREMGREPLGEDTEKLMRESEKDVTGLVGTSIGYSLENGFDFIVIDRRDDGSNQGACRHAMVGE